MDGGSMVEGPMPTAQAPMDGAAPAEDQVEISGEEATKKAKISKAQQYMFFAVLGASMVAGISFVVSMFLLRYINFNMRVISGKDEAIAAYSKAIEETGACKKPTGSIYTMAELEKCDPNNVEASQVEGSLRAKILNGMTGNADLESVARETVVSVCYNSKTGKPYTYKTLQKEYQNASNKGDRNLREYYLGLIKMCSSLRVIPDALPSVSNETAMMSSVGQIFRVSGTQQDSLSSNASGGISSVPGLNVMTLGLEITEEINQTKKVLSDFEKSIRNFDINSATIQWNDDKLTVGAQMSAYYMDQASVVEKTVTIDPEDKK